MKDQVRSDREIDNNLIFKRSCPKAFVVPIIGFLADHPIKDLFIIFARIKIDDFTDDSYMKVILVVDDDIGVLELVEEILSDEGYKVVALTRCKDILEIVREHHPDLVIMDYFLQGQNGGMLCRLLKQTAQTARIPILLYSAYPNIEKSLDHFGCDAFLAKPFDIAKLTQHVRNLLRQAA